MLTKIDQAPTIQRIRQARPYLVHPDNGQIYGFYSVLVTWADGTRKEFDSEEEANAYVERRAVKQTAIEAEVPVGFREAQAVIESFNVIDEENVTVSQTEFDVLLTGYAADKKISVIKMIRELTGKGLSESKELATNLPAMIAEAFESDAANDVKRKLEEAGGTVELR